MIEQQAVRERDPHLRGVITCTPGVLGGMPCVAGTRIPVWVVATGDPATILDAYPGLSPEDVAACRAWWAEQDYTVVQAALAQMELEIMACREGLAEADSTRVADCLRRIAGLARRPAKR